MKYQKVNILKIMTIYLAILLLGLINASITYAQTENYSFVTKWGSFGTGDGNFMIINGVATDSLGNVFAIDYMNSRVEKFDSDGNFITKWGSLGNGKGRFLEPLGIAVDSSGNVYVSDENNLIQKFDNNGKFLTQWGGDSGIVIKDFNGNFKWLTPSGYDDNSGLFYYPSSIAIDSLDNVYVVDKTNRRIQKFDGNGNFITNWGGLSDGKFDLRFGAPHGIAIDSSGNMYVTDTKNFCVKKFESSGTLTTQWGSYGTGDGQFVNPLGIAIDSSNDVYVSDASTLNTSPSEPVNQPERIEKFDSNGKFITEWGKGGTGDGQFRYPNGIAVDPSGSNVYISDGYNNRIQKFSLNKNIFYPGINWTEGDTLYKKIADELNAKRMDSYKNTNLFSGATQVYLASKKPPIATETNFLAFSSDTGTYNITFAHSGGTRTLVDKIESGTVKTNYVVLAAPALITQEELQELITNYGVKKVVVFQSDGDMLNLLNVTLRQNYLFRNLNVAPVMMIRLEDIPNLHYKFSYLSEENFYKAIDDGLMEDKFKKEFELKTEFELEKINGSHYLILNIKPYFSQFGLESDIIEENTFWVGGADRDKAKLFVNWRRYNIITDIISFIDSIKSNQISDTSSIITGVINIGSNNWGQNSNINDDIIVVNFDKKLLKDPMYMHSKLGTNMADYYANSMGPFDGSIPGLKGLK